MMPAWSELQQLQWRFPWGALLVALLPLLLGWLARRQQQQLARYADAALLPWAVLKSAPGVPTNGRRWIELLAWGLLALAAAGPRLPVALPGGSEEGPARPHVIDLMVVLDVSASMAATDVAPDRLTRARLELADLLQRLHGERTGLLLYAGQAGVLLPPTDDKALFERALAQAGADLLAAPGSDVAQALRLAGQALRVDDGAPASRSRAVLLVSDAESSTLDGAAGEAVQQAVQQAVQALRTEGIPLFVLVMASRQGTTVLLPDGARAMQDGVPFISRPALGAWRRLAGNTGGALALVRDGGADWDALYDEGLARLPGTAVADTEARDWRELFMWPLALALFLLLFCLLPPGTRHVAPLGMLLALWLGGGGVLPRAEAADVLGARATTASTAQAAAQAWRDGQWQQALPLFERQGGYAGHMGAGAAAWKLRDPVTAARHFSQALLLARHDGERDDALYNLGNAHYVQGRWFSAAQAWRAVLLSRPGDARAAANLAHAEAQLAKRAGGAPMRSDLRGRRGFVAEGRVGVDDGSSAQDESLLLSDLPQMPRSTGRIDATGAQLNSVPGAGGAPMVAVDPQRLQSGLVKLERLEDRKRELLRGLLKQDRVPASSASSAGGPW